MLFTKQKKKEKRMNFKQVKAIKIDYISVLFWVID